jgi:hypothetical protein
MFILQPEKKFAGSILRQLLFNQFNLTDIRKLLQPLPAGKRKIAHLINFPDPLQMEPADNLIRPITLLPDPGQLLNQLLAGHTLKINFIHRETDNLNPAKTSSPAQAIKGAKKSPGFTLRAL